MKTSPAPAWLALALLLLSGCGVQHRSAAPSRSANDSGAFPPGDRAGAASGFRGTTNGAGSGDLRSVSHGQGTKTASGSTSVPVAWKPPGEVAPESAPGEVWTALRYGAAPGAASREPAFAAEPGRPTRIRLFYATSRKPVAPGASDPDQHPRYYGTEWRMDALTYGVAWVTMPTDRVLPPGEIEGSTWLSFDLPDNPRDDVWMHRPKEFAGTNEFLAALAEDIPRRAHRSVLIGVHGFNNSFEFAGRRLGKMVHDMNYHGTPVLYSWAAGDGVADYGHDEEQVEQPREVEHFTTFLEQVTLTARAAGARKVHLVAHSMGNRLLRQAAIRLAERHRGGPRLFDTVILAAPDLPQRGFGETIWPSITNIAGRCALYVSAYDRALFGSAKLHRSGPRLGQAGEKPLVLAGLETIDSSNVKNTFMHHDNHLRLAGICDLSACLVRDLPPADRVARRLLRIPRGATAATWYELLEGESTDCVLTLD